ncbi:MAG: DUF1778 domain-containing protein [Microcystaceae cyanobacterium]
MVVNTSSKPATARLEARTTQEIKDLIQRAAELEGRSITDFVVASAQAHAYEVIKKHQILQLSTEDSKAFVEALVNPPEPNDQLKAAASRYKKMMSI